MPCNKYFNEEIRNMKQKFQKKSISESIFVSVSILIILISVIFMSSTFLILRHQLLDKTQNNADKDVMMVQEKLQMFLDRKSVV